MRNALYTLAAAATAFAFAAPATAQWYPQPQPQPRGYAYGYQQNYGQVRAMQVRLNHLQREISRLANYRMITRNEYAKLLSDSAQIERRLMRDARDGRGLTRNEMYNIERRIQRLEYKISRDVRDGRQNRYRW